jgi:hypothetical protein
MPISLRVVELQEFLTVETSSLILKHNVEIANMIQEKGLDASLSAILDYKIKIDKILDKIESDIINKK